MPFLRTKKLYNRRTREKTDYLNVYKSEGRVNGRRYISFYYCLQRKKKDYKSMVSEMLKLLPRR